MPWWNRLSWRNDRAALFRLAVLALPFKSKLRLEAENAVLRHQLIILRRRLPGRVRLTNHDRWFFIQLYRWFPQSCRFSQSSGPRRSCVGIGPGFVATGVGNRAHWEGDRDRNGAARVDPADEPRKSTLGRAASTANCSSSGLRSRSRASPSTWSNGGDRPARDGEPSCITTRRTLPPWTCSLFQRSVSTCSMPSSSSGTTAETSSGSITANPTAEWVARQITEAFPWDGAPGYMIRDRDRIYGAVVTRRLRAMGIRDRPIAPASPWQNGFAERLIGSIRRECLDHVIVLGEHICAEF